MRIFYLSLLAVCCGAQFRQQPSDKLVAMSFMTRNELADGQYSRALPDAEQVEQLVRGALAGRTLDSDPNLALALGASFEVQAQSLAALNRRSEALSLLQTAEREWRSTSIMSRLQKNVLLLTMVGHQLPELRGVSNTWRGKPVLIFFWAHWCADCKADSPVIAKLATEFEPKGLVVVAPTKFYGYTAQEEQASPTAEKQFIDLVFKRFYSKIPRVIVPLEQTNFDRFGVSTTPTIVAADSRGVVRLYHPGYMDEASLRQAIEQVMK